MGIKDESTVGPLGRSLDQRFYGAPAGAPDLVCGDGTNARHYFVPPGPCGDHASRFDDTSGGTPTESFLDEAGPIKGPSPAVPGAVPEEEDAAGREPRWQARATRFLADLIVDSTRDTDNLTPVSERILLRKTENLRGEVANYEIHVGGDGYLSLGTEAPAVIEKFLGVAEAIVQRIDVENEEEDGAQRNLTLYNAREHVREIRSALSLPEFEVGQVWRLVDTREITIQYVLDGRVTARVTREYDEDEEASSPTLEYDLDGVLFDQSIDPQPYTIFYCAPIALLSVLTEQGRVPPVAVPVQRPPGEKWPDGRTVAVGVDERTKQAVVVPVRPANPGLAKTLDNLAAVKPPRKPKKTKTKE